MRTLVCMAPDCGISVSQDTAYIWTKQSRIAAGIRAYLTVCSAACEAATKADMIRSSEHGDTIAVSRGSDAFDAVATEWRDNYAGIRLDNEPVTSSWRRSRYQWADYWIAEFGSRPMRNIREIDIRKGLTKLKVASSTKRRYLNVVTEIFEQASADGIFKGSNPTLRIKKARGRNAQTQDRRGGKVTRKALRPEEREILRAMLPRTDLRQRNVYVATMLSMYSGARRGEVTALTWNKWDDGSLRIDQEIVKTDDGPGTPEYWIFSPETKSGEPRTVQVMSPQFLDEMLTEHREYQNEVRRIAGIHWNDNNFILADAFGDFVLPNGITATYQKECKRLQIFWERLATTNKETGKRPMKTQSPGFHYLRNTFGFYMADNGYSLMEIQAAMGHKDARTTSKYLVPDSEAVAQSIRERSAALEREGVA